MLPSYYRRQEAHLRAVGSVCGRVIKSLSFRLRAKKLAPHLGGVDLVKEFRDFILRGNVVDLAIAVVIGIAFGAVVTAFVENIITPLIAAIVGQQDFAALDFTIRDSVFGYGIFLNALISFVSVAAVVFFFIVKPMNMLLARTKADAAPPPPPALSAEAQRFLNELTEALRGLK